MELTQEIMLPTIAQEPITRDPKTLILYSRPKIGKTSALSLLPNNLIIDLEEGSDHVGGLIIKANNFTELRQVKDALIKNKDAGTQYDYITLDTTSALEECAKELAGILYKNTPMGKAWKGLDITDLPNGAGYKFLRDAFIMIVNQFKPLAKKCLILSGHVKDKLVAKDGEEVITAELDLTGKLSSIMCSKVDAICILNRKDGVVIANFNGNGDAIIEARADHLSGKEIVLTEKQDDGSIKANWDKVFLELNK